MNEYALLHRMDSEYCYPSSESDLTIRLRCAKGDMESVWLCYESKYVIQTSQKKVPMKRVFSGELFDYFSVTLHEEDTRLAYVFYLYDGKDYRFYSEEGLSETYDYTLGFYNFFQYPYINPADVVRDVPWMHEARFYQIFVDRFAMGESKKDTSYINLKWGEIPNPKSFAGGDLRGIREKLDYIGSLGINALYLTPVFSSVSNHKYDISDYYRIDEQFGTSRDLKELVDACHAKGMHILLDAVFNHCSEDLPQFRDVVEKGRKSPYFDWFIIRGDRPEKDPLNYEVFAFCDYMPKLNTSNPEVAEFLTGVATHYIREYGIDGWRLDVSDEVSHDFWRTFRKAVKAENPQAVIIGENWHNASNYLRGDQYDSIMNYSFTKCCLDFFARKKLTADQAADRLNDLLARNNNVVNDLMLNLLDTHDTHRFFSEVGEQEEVFRNALYLLYFFPGVPCIFYGTEIMIPGGYDPDCRRCMDWEKAGKVTDTAVYRDLQLLTDLRRKYSFRTDSVRIYSENGLLVVEYREDGEGLTLVINNTDEDRDSTFGTVKKNDRIVIR